MSEATNIVTVVTDNPVVVLTDPQKYSDFYKAMRAETDAFVPDLSTVASRKAIASLAHKVTRTKTAIDMAGKLLNEEARKKINVVDATRRTIWDELEALAADVRKPLTDWEAAEDEREARVKAVLEDIRSSGVVLAEDTAQSVEYRLAHLQTIVIDDTEFQGHADIARNALTFSRDALFNVITRLEKEERDRAELERLREEQAEREAKELAEKEAAAAKAAFEAIEKAAAEKEAAAKAAHQAAIEAAAKAAETAAREASERKADDERRERENAHTEALAAEKRRADEAEAAVKAEADRVAKERAAQEAETKRIADEQAARDADRAHRGKVMGAAKEAMIELGCDADVAKKIVLAIVAGEIPAVTLRF